MFRKTDSMIHLKKQLSSSINISFTRYHENKILTVGHSNLLFRSSPSFAFEKRKVSFRQNYLPYDIPSTERPHVQWNFYVRSLPFKFWKVNISSDNIQQSVRNTWIWLFTRKFMFECLLKRHWIIHGQSWYNVGIS